MRHYLVVQNLVRYVISLKFFVRRLLLMHFGSISIDPRAQKEIICMLGSKGMHGGRV